MTEDIEKLLYKIGFKRINDNFQCLLFILNDKDAEYILSYSLEYKTNPVSGNSEYVYELTKLYRTNGEVEENELIHTPIDLRFKEFINQYFKDKIRKNKISKLIDNG